MNHDYWLGPNIGSTDLISMLTKGNRHQWTGARKNMAAMQLYVQQLTDESQPVIGPNSFEALAATGAFEWLRKKGIEVWCEGGLYKEGQDTHDNYLRLCQADHNVGRAGGELIGITLDEPLRAGEREGESPESAERSLFEYTRLLSEDELRVVLIEPYPFFPLDQWLGRVLPIADAAGCAGIHIDVDPSHAATPEDGVWFGPKLLHDVQNICDIAKDRYGLDTGIIVTGNAAVPGWQDGKVTSATYCYGGKRAADAYAGMNLANVDRFIVQSWHRNGEDTSVPRNVPEHVGLFDYVVERLG